MHSNQRHTFVYNKEEKSNSVLHIFPDNIKWFEWTVPRAFCYVCSLLISTVCGSLLTNFVFTVSPWCCQCSGVCARSCSFSSFDLVQAFHHVPSSSLFRPSVGCVRRCRVGGWWSPCKCAFICRKLKKKKRCFVLSCRFSWVIGTCSVCPRFFRCCYLSSKEKKKKRKERRDKAPTFTTEMFGRSRFALHELHDYFPFISFCQC